MSRYQGKHYRAPRHRFGHVLIVALLVVALALLLTFVGRASAEETHEYTSEQVALVQALNDYRAAHGLPPLLLSALLTEAAQKHSVDMGTYGFFAHESEASDYFAVGSTPKQRMVAVGYTFNTYTGENIAAGFTTAQAVVNAWSGSSSHNANMLNQNYQVAGVGFFYRQGSPYRYYWTVDFGGYVDPSAQAVGTTTSTTTTTEVSTTTSTTEPSSTTTTSTSTTTTTLPPETTTTTIPPQIPGRMEQIQAFLSAHKSNLPAWTLYFFEQAHPDFDLVGFLTVMWCESSLGTTGGSARYHNPGNIKWGGWAIDHDYFPDKPWYLWMSGYWYCRGQGYYGSYRDIYWGQRSAIRLIYNSPLGYNAKLAAHDWWGFANYYYGRNVPGISQYVRNLEAAHAYISKWF